jgi:hypothetical protein
MKHTEEQLVKITYFSRFLQKKYNFLKKEFYGNRTI